MRHWITSFQLLLPDMKCRVFGSELQVSRHIVSRGGAPTRAASAVGVKRLSYGMRTD
jgi:hypothetical protein